jgi:threonine/homoserine/homoserine lactone efflux protein
MIFPDPALHLAFFIAAIALIVTPGPDMAYVATRTLVSGRAAGAAAALGVQIGSFVHLILAIVGLSAVLLHSEAAFTAVKLAGAAYLVWVAIGLWRDPGNGTAVAPALAATRWRAFADGALSNILNPKVALFYVALLPQFIDPARGGIASQLVVLHLTFVGAATLFWIVFIPATWRAGAMLSASQTVTRWLRRAMALFFVAVAARLAFSTRS